MISNMGKCPIDGTNIQQQKALVNTQNIEKVHNKRNSVTRGCLVLRCYGVMVGELRGLSRRRLI